MAQVERDHRRKISNCSNTRGGDSIVISIFSSEWIDGELQHCICALIPCGKGPSYIIHLVLDFLKSLYRYTSDLTKAFLKHLTSQRGFIERVPRANKLNYSITNQLDVRDDLCMCGASLW